MKKPYKATNPILLLGNKGDHHKTYGIDEYIPSVTAIEGGHVAKIHVYGDIRLRNKILRLLNAATMKH